MEDQYFETTTLYALGRALAAERLLALDGVYPQLETLYPGLGSFLIKNQIDLALGEGFYKYDRLVLAEAVMQRDGDRLRVSTYIEFRGRYEGQRESETRVASTRPRSHRIHNTGKHKASSETPREHRPSAIQRDRHPHRAAERVIEGCGCGRVRIDRVATRAARGHIIVRRLSWVGTRASVPRARTSACLSQTQRLFHRSVHASDRSCHRASGAPSRSG